MNDIVLKFQMSQDVPENLIDTVIELGLNLSAELQRDEEYIFLKKIYIQALIQLGKKDRALEELDDWDIIFPGDEDFINFRKCFLICLKRCYYFNKLILFVKLPMR